MKYIIEHLDGKVYNWSLLEYTHCSKIVGKNNLIFTNVKGKKAQEKLADLGETHMESVTDDEFLEYLETSLTLNRVCILDPLAEKELSPEDASNFDFLIFGGILGNYPPDKRTKTKISNKLECEKRNLGNVQMSTNTAVYAAHTIINGKRFSDLKFVDELIIPMEDGLDVELPFRYIIENGKPVLAPDFLEFLKNRKGF